MQYTTISVLHRRLSPLKMLMHWTLTFFGNLAGSLFTMAIIIGYGGVFNAAAYKHEVEAFAMTKVVTPEWHMILLRGIGANWLVCPACFLAFMAREYFSKVVAIWWPTFAFVCLGFDHVVANMFFVPTAIFLGAPEITVGYYIWKSMIPALIGNILGGGLFVGVVYWYLVSPNWHPSNGLRLLMPALVHPRELGACPNRRRHVWRGQPATSWPSCR